MKCEYINSRVKVEIIATDFKRTIFRLNERVKKINPTSLQAIYPSQRRPSRKRIVANANTYARAKRRFINRVLDVNDNGFIRKSFVGKLTFRYRNTLVLNSNPDRCDNVKSTRTRLSPFRH